MQFDDLEQTRREIDRLDDEIVRLLNQRARVAQRVGATKDAAARGAYAPDRERAVLARVRTETGDGPLTAEHVTAIYRQIISACRSLERSLRVAYLGPAATFTHQAAIHKFGEATAFVPVASIPDVFAEVQRGAVDFGVVPVENSTEGAVHETLDSFVDSDLRVCAEIVLPIAFELLSTASRREAIKTIYSNPVALAQCRQWVARNFPDAETVTAVSTARAATMAAEDATGAAIANELAATEYGLNVMETNIQDVAANYTRFFVIAPPIANEPTGNDKTAVLFSIRDRVGALRDMADVFAHRGINMTSIQSRPSRRRLWDYVFFVEIVGHSAEPAIQEALQDLEQLCVFVKVLGSWAVDY